MPRDIINGHEWPPRELLGVIPAAASFVPVYADETGELLTEPAAGDVEFGSASVRYALKPRADQKLDLGGASRRFFDGYFAGDVKGCRRHVAFGYAGTFSATTWLRLPDSVPCSANNGYPMLRPGSIIGVAGQFKVNAVTTAGTVAVRSYINGTAKLFKAVSIGAGDVGNFLVGTAGQTRGVDTFAAGDYIGADINFLTFVGTLELASMIVELALDT